jgi:hypothetical protein
VCVCVLPYYIHIRFPAVEITRFRIFTVRTRYDVENFPNSKNKVYIENHKIGMSFMRVYIYIFGDITIYFISDRQ